jgi:thymidine kinase
MFLEPFYVSNLSRGWVEVITGPMFSGKTEELIRRLKRAKIASRKVAIFKPEIDQRYSADAIVSHDESRIDSIRIKRAIEIVDQIDKAEVIGVDEVQFFNEAIIDVVQYLALKGKRVIVSGLDMDSNGNPFHPMPQLLCIAEFVTKLHAICLECGAPASHSFRYAGSEDLIHIGAKESYKPLCRFCFQRNMKKDAG